MALFSGDDSFSLVNRVSPLAAVLIGAGSGYFLSNLVVLVLSVVLMVLIVLAAIDSIGKEICRFFNYEAIARLALILVVMWIVTITVNHWWHSILPHGILR